MKVRVIRDKSKAADSETTQIVRAISWATLIQESTNEMWKLSDAKVAEAVQAQVADLLDYDATHDEWGNPVDAILVRLGKGGYSVATIFDDPLPIWQDNETCV